MDEKFMIIYGFVSERNRKKRNIEVLTS